MTRLQHGPYESGDVIFLLHTSQKGVSTVGPLVVEACVPLEDGTHWRVECHRDGMPEATVTVGADGLDTGGRVHTEAGDIRTHRAEVIRTALFLAAIERDIGRQTAAQTAAHSMMLDAAQDDFEQALDYYVATVNKFRAGAMH